MALRRRSHPQHPHQRGEAWMHGSLCPTTRRRLRQQVAYPREDEGEGRRVTQIQGCRVNAACLYFCFIHPFTAFTLLSLYSSYLFSPLLPLLSALPLPSLRCPQCRPSARLHYSLAQSIQLDRILSILQQQCRPLHRLLVCCARPLLRLLLSRCHRLP